MIHGRLEPFQILRHEMMLMPLGRRVIGTLWQEGKAKIGQSGQASRRPSQLSIIGANGIVIIIVVSRSPDHDVPGMSIIGKGYAWHDIITIDKSPGIEIGQLFHEYFKAEVAHAGRAKRGHVDASVDMMKGKIRRAVVEV